MKTQQLEIKLSNKMEEDIKKARRKSTQAGTPGWWVGGWRGVHLGVQDCGGVRGRSRGLTPLDLRGRGVGGGEAAGLPVL